MASKEQIDQYFDEGYYIADDAVEPELLDLHRLALVGVEDGFKCPSWR